MNPETDQTEQSDKSWTGCFSLSLILYALASIGITVLTFFKMNSASYDFADIATNWQTGAIMDVTVQPSCPTGYEEAFNYTWPGNSEGCFCGNVSLGVKLTLNINSDMTYGSCYIDDRLAGCDDVNSNPSVLIANWGQVNSTDMKVCVLRSQETWLQVAQQSGPNCTNNNSSLKQCGFSPENMFCTSEAECPINDVQVQNLTLPAQSAQLANCTSQNNCTVLAQSASSAKVLYYQRGDTYDALPTAQMSLNEYSMCLDSTENDITPGRSNFYLLNSKRSTCYNQGASMWNLTDSMTEAELFSLNELTNTITYLEPFGYYSDGEDGSDYTYSIFSRSYIPWNINCRGSMNSIIYYTPKVQTVRNLQLALMIVTIICGILLGIVLPGLLVYILKESHASKTKEFASLGIEMEGLHKTKMWAKRINHGAKLPMLGLQIAVLVYSVNTRGFFQSIMDDNCSTPAVMQTLTSVAELLHINYVCNIVNISLQVALVIIGCCYFHRRQSAFNSGNSEDKLVV